MRRQRHDAIDDGVWIGTIPDQIAEHQGPVEAAPLGQLEAGIERLEVRMDVGQDKIAHGIRVQGSGFRVRGSGF